MFAKALRHAFVSSRVDGCNAMLAGSSKATTDRLQRVLNAAARVVSGTHKFDRVSHVPPFQGFDGHHNFHIPTPLTNCINHT